MPRLIPAEMRSSSCRWVARRSARPGRWRACPPVPARPGANPCPPGPARPGASDAHNVGGPVDPRRDVHDMRHRTLQIRRAEPRRLQAGVTPVANAASDAARPTSGGVAGLRPSVACVGCTTWPRMAHRMPRFVRGRLGRAWSAGAGWLGPADWGRQTGSCVVGWGRLAGAGRLGRAWLAGAGWGRPGLAAGRARAGRGASRASLYSR